MFKYLTIAALLAVAFAGDSQVCYEDLGCFSKDYPFSDDGRVARLPESPEHIETEFMLYTRRNSDLHHTVVANELHTLTTSRFNGSNPTKFIIHGWIDGPGIGPWMQDMAKQFMLVEDCNAFVIDWSKGSRAMYSQSVANTRVVGAQIAQMIDFLKAETGANPSQMHILGHSLGSHVAGYAGERVPGLGRITGMDPAGPYFQGMDKAVRLDETDADFVDIVHTDGESITSILNPFNDVNGMGLMEKCGHLDVYPNGGEKQPGCGDRGPIANIIGDGIVEGIRYTVACAHMRALDYTMESLASSCPWKSYKCPQGYDEFITGRCLRCPADGDNTACNRVAALSTMPHDGSINNELFMVTGDKSPFCRYHYHITLKISSEKNKEQKGLVWIKLFGDHEETEFMPLGDDNFYITKGASYDFLATSPVGIKEIRSIELEWEHDASILELGQWQIGKPTIIPESVTAFAGEFQSEAKYCNDDGEIKSKKSRRFTRNC